jgi:uncharacterized SAM-binding protein YcdF (DUF218 family)
MTPMPASRRPSFFAAFSAARAASRSRTHAGAGARVPAVPLEAIVVLGCAVRLDAGGRLVPGPLARRVEAAARLYEERADDRTIVIASGGRRWGAAVEADAMARELGLRGVPSRVIVRERGSLSTWDNARFAAAVLARRDMTAAAVVTCSWHLPRSVALFSLAGIDAWPVAAGLDPREGALGRMWRWAREWVLTGVEGVDGLAMPSRRDWGARRVQDRDRGGR